MKKILALLLVLVLSFACFACAQTPPDETPDNGGNTDGGNTDGGNTDGGNTDDVKVMTHAEFVAAEVESPVVIEAYVQATQSWWNNKITVYLQDENGGYFAYEMKCPEEQKDALVKGQKIRVSGYKAEWSGEIEIVDCEFEVLDGNWVATPRDLTDKLGTEDLIKHQNELALFKGMTIKEISYKNNEPTDDIYLTLTKGDADYDFCVERYLTGPETALYEYVGTLQAGDVVDVEGFVYWYNGLNTHIVSMNKAQKSEGVMTYLEYVNAPIDSEVVIEAYVQATQSWWNDKITVYLQDEDGAYFAYNMACTEEQSETLVKGQKIRVTGYKAEWSGEIEIVDCTFEVLEGNWVATPRDLTDKLGTDALVHYQNQLALFKGLTVKAISYKNNEPGDDIYLTFTLGEADYDFCIEYYLTNDNTEVYQFVATLEVGDVVNVEGFVYWYNGVNTHITAITGVADQPAI